MAVTGIILIGFVTGHLIGNLLIFLGPDWINNYSAHLVGLGPLLWLIRVFLLAMVGLHIISAIQLTIENRKARPKNYQFRKTIQTTYAARTMAFSGLIVLAFIIYHLLQFTFRVTDPAVAHLTDALGRHDVYSMVVRSFQNIYVSAAYIVALALLCFHLNHGIGSLFQSLGLNNERTLKGLSWGGKIYSFLLFIGYASIPATVLLGLVKVV